MLFNQGAKVYTEEGDVLGTIARIVIEPKTREVSHVIVQKGLLFTKDKVIPMRKIASATEDQVILVTGIRSLDEFPNYYESDFIAAENGELPGTAAQTRVSTYYWYPSLGSFGSYVSPEVPTTFVPINDNIPDHAVAIASGAKIITCDDVEVGSIEQIFTDTTSGHATHMLISKGLFINEEKLIPTRWIADVTEDEILLSVNSKIIERLPVYEAEH